MHDKNNHQCVQINEKIENKIEIDNPDNDEINLTELLKVIWEHKFVVISFVFVIMSIATVFVLSKPNEYRIYAVLVPQEEAESTDSAQSALPTYMIEAGNTDGPLYMIKIDVGNNKIAPEVAFKKLLENYKFMKNFVIKKGINKKLNGNIEKDYVFALHYDGLYKFFKKLKKHKKIGPYKAYAIIKRRFSISKDTETGLITISFTHPSRKFGYYVLTSFLDEGTRFLINKDVQDIDSRIKKYQTELQLTNNLEVKSALAKLISLLMQRKVYINASRYYKMKVLTEPYIPNATQKVKPKRGLILVASFIVSLILGVFLTFVIDFMQKSKEK